MDRACREIIMCKVRCEKAKQFINEQLHTNEATAPPFTARFSQLRAMYMLFHIKNDNKHFAFIMNRGLGESVPRRTFRYKRGFTVRKHTEYTCVNMCLHVSA